MLSKVEHNDVVWVDVEAPTRQELEYLVERFEVPPHIAEELAVKSVNSRIELIEPNIYLVLRLPRRSVHGKFVHDDEIDILIGRGFVATVHSEHINTLERFFKSLELERNRSHFFKNAPILLVRMISSLYHEIGKDLEDVRHDLKNVENHIFKGDEAKMVREISEISRLLLNYKHNLQYHGEVLRSLKLAGIRVFGESFSYELSWLIGEYNKVVTLLDSQKEILRELKDTNDSLLSSKTNKTMKTLTIISFMILPMTLVSSVFAINIADGTRIIQNKEQFILLLILMGVVQFLMFVYFKAKKWL